LRGVAAAGCLFQLVASRSQSFIKTGDEMTPTFENYILDLIKIATNDYGLKAGPETIYADYNKVYVDGKTREEYWTEVVEKRLLKVTPLYEEAWDPDTQTLRVDTNFSKYLINPDESNGFPAVWSSGNNHERNQEAFKNANKWILVAKTQKGKNFLQKFKTEIILECYEKVPTGKIHETVCEKLDDLLGDKLLEADPLLKKWFELSYSGALKHKSEKVKPWISMVHNRATKNQLTS